jgi:CBS domain-containing protein
MAFVSELTGRPVTDYDGTRVGVLKDLVASTRPEFAHPVIDAVIVDSGDRQFPIPYSDLAALLSAAIPLKRPLADIQPYVMQENDLLLVKDVLDKQILDTDDARVVRVNDIEVVRVNGNVVVSNVDIGLLGILRRIGMEGFGQWLTRFTRLDASQGVISWDFVEPLRHDQFMRLKVPADTLTDLHPADIAEIISDLNRSERKDLLGHLSVEQLADTLEEVEPDFQAHILEHLSDDKVADVLEEMSPDDAADLLGELDDERKESLLGLMEKEEAEEVRDLLKYDEDTAGGIMTTEYVTVLPNMTAQQTIDHLRKVGEEAELVYYVYVTDEQEHLMGVFSLSDLICAQPDTPITEIMHKRVVSVEVDSEQEEVAHAVAKYNLIAVPVVDAENRMQGIVTSDDALDKIIPTAWKKRLPHFFGALE